MKVTALVFVAIFSIAQGGPLAAAPLTIGFSGLPNPAGATIFFYEEAGFTAVGTGGGWSMASIGGSPALFLNRAAGQPTVNGTLSISAGRSSFTWSSFDLYASAGAVPYTVTGTLNSHVVFSIDKTLPAPMGSIVTITNDHPAAIIDTLTIAIVNPTSAALNNVALDSIVGTITGGTIQFAAFERNNGAVFTSSVDVGFDVTSSFGPWTINSTFGGAPYIQLARGAGQPTIAGEVSITSAGALFNFTSVDIRAGSGPVQTVVTGRIGAVAMYEFITTANPAGSVAILTNPYASIPVNTVVISLLNPTSAQANQVGLHNIVVGQTPFSDDPPVARSTTIKALHVLELRGRIQAVRARLGLAPYAYTNATISPGGSAIAAVDIAQLRLAINETFVARGVTPLRVFTDPTLTAGVTIKRSHLFELRDALSFMERIPPF